MSKKILSLLLCLVFLSSVCAIPALAAEDTPDQLQVIFDDLNAKDKTCDTVEQQIVNGLYSCVQMAGILSMQYA